MAVHNCVKNLRKLKENTKHDMKKIISKNIRNAQLFTSKRTYARKVNE